jgi:transcriptional regulator with XRE-family HTH domain
MNYDALTSELVRALRGRRSQGAINRKLGRSSNAVHAWEHGSRSPRASDFFKLGRLAGVDVAHVLAQFTDAPAQPPRALDANVGAERLARPALPPKSQYSYNLFAISDQGLEQIRQAHLHITSACGRSSPNASTRRGLRC